MRVTIPGVIQSIILPDGGFLMIGVINYSRAGTKPCLRTK